MGVDIVQLGNHNVQFKGKMFIELVNEIKPILEKNKIENIDYLQFALLDYYEGKDWLEEECGNMAREGLRTLVVAKKILTEEQYMDFEVCVLYTHYYKLVYCK
jgi:hypothetical protein